ncbi:Beta-galactosidase 5 [Hibiscus syriacus]|uniref:beta-galactosidase n=1 Tax=Hibiscus syriacus TaxID=106335 RepID=A0A6A2XNB9_HIBSY|nr:Beta-galactosidase 5 [Hibiscus syriacus]
MANGKWQMANGKWQMANGKWQMANGKMSSSQLIHCSVTYDKKAILINGQRRILISGSIHYPRSTPEMWEDLIKKAKSEAWMSSTPMSFGTVMNLLLATYDLVRFIKTVQNRDYTFIFALDLMFVQSGIWRISRLAKVVPGISFRTDNEPFKIENEYGPESKALGAAGHAYINWAAKMAVELNTGVPWVMCKEDDAPDPMINACNGFYCDAFSPNKPYKPTLWTEAWSGWFTEFGGTIHQRPVQDLAFAVARFIQKYHGGTNFGRTAGGPFITTSYDYDAPIDEYGEKPNSFSSHLKELHKAIKLCEHALVSSDPTVTSLGTYHQVTFNNRHYDLPPWSISILPDCKHVAFNTALVIILCATRLGLKPRESKCCRRTPRLSWEAYDEDISSLGESSTTTAPGLLDQINVTRDKSDYLWYTTSVDISPSESFLRGGRKPTLNVDSAGHALHVFINGQLSGPANLHAGTNRIALLSVAVGLQNVGVHYETWKTGIQSVSLHGLDQRKKDLTWQKWSYQVGLKGESMNLVSPKGLSSVEWIRGSLAARSRQSMTWYKVYFNAPGGNEPLALDMRSMGKGQVWINGQSLGRYWMAYAKGDCSTCSYLGTFRPTKCQSGCGQPTQRWYHVPRSWLKPTRNLLVVFEELGGDASKISLVRRSVL